MGPVSQTSVPMTMCGSAVGVVKMSANVLYVVGGVVQVVALWCGADYGAIGITLMILGFFTMMRGWRL